MDLSESEPSKIDMIFGYLLILSLPFLVWLALDPPTFFAYIRELRLFAK